MRPYFQTFNIHDIYRAIVFISDGAVLTPCVPNSFGAGQQPIFVFLKEVEIRVCLGDLDGNDHIQARLVKGDSIPYMGAGSEGRGWLKKDNAIVTDPLLFIIIKGMEDDLIGTGGIGSQSGGSFKGNINTVLIDDTDDII